MGSEKWTGAIFLASVFRVLCLTTWHISADYKQSKKLIVQKRPPVALTAIAGGFKMYSYLFVPLSFA